MTECIHRCDRCQAIILEGRSLLHIESGPLRARFGGAIDLCHDCAGVLLQWLADPARESNTLWNPGYPMECANVAR